MEAEFRRRGKVARDLFLDIHDWPKGKASPWAIRDALLASEFMIAWISPAYLRSRRGWIWMELTLAQLLEDSLNLGLGIRHPFVLAVFRGVTVRTIAKTPWIDYLHRAVVSPHERLEIPQIAKQVVKVHERALRDRGR